MLPVKFQETVKIFRKYRSINQQHSSRIRGGRTLKPTACGCRKTTLLKSFRRHIRGNIPFEHSTDVTTIRGGKKSFSPSCNSFPPITWHRGHSCIYVKRVIYASYVIINANIYSYITCLMMAQTHGYKRKKILFFSFLSRVLFKNRKGASMHPSVL